MWEWIAEVDRYTGQERQTTDGATPRRFSIFAGANPGPENCSIDLLDGRFTLWCTDKRTKEVEQGKGWTGGIRGRSLLRPAIGCSGDHAVSQALAVYWRLRRKKTVNHRTGIPATTKVYRFLTGSNAPLSGDIDVSDISSGRTDKQARDYCQGLFFS